MNPLDQARSALELHELGRRWAFDWSDISRDDREALLHAQRARIFETSGTTGAPKAVRRDPVKLMQELEVTAMVLGSGHDHVHATVDPRSLYGYVGVFIGAYLGVPVTFDQWGVTRQPVSGQNPLIFTVPATWRSFAAQASIGSNARVTVVHAGAMLPAVVSDFARRSEASVRIVDLFGTTETGMIGSREVLAIKPAVWEVAPDVVMEFASIDEHGEGRPRVRGTRVAPAEGAAEGEGRILDDWLVPAGQRRFGFNGRRERVAKPGGRRVDVDLLEAQISVLLPGIDTACVIREHHTLGESIELIAAVPEALVKGLERQLHSARVEQLSYVPNRVSAVKAIPRSAMGKVRRVAVTTAEEATP